MEETSKYKITKGKVEKPLFILLYGPDKVGKSTWAASAPNPVFICTEEGSNQLDVARYEKPGSFHEVKAQIKQTIEEPEYKTLVIDSIDWLEPMIFEQVCAESDKMPKTIADIPFGKGYPLAVQKWREILEELDKVIESGKTVILLAHSVLKRFEDPSAPTGYDRFQLKLYDGSTTSKTESSADLIKQRVDAILFANFKVYPNSEDKRRAYGDGTRVIYPERRPAYDAGNRFGITDEMPLSDWDTFLAFVSPKRSEAENGLRTIIKEMAGKVKDEAVRKKIEEAIPKKKNLLELQQLKTKVEAAIGSN